MTPDEFKKLLKAELRPLKEDIEVTKSKASRIDSRQGLISLSIKSLKDQQSVINEKLDSLDEKISTLDGKVDILDEKIDGVLRFANIIEEERDKNDKRIRKIETKLALTA